MKPENLNITFPLLTNGTDSALMIGYAPIFEYDKESKQKTEKITGHAYEIVLDSNNFDKLFVKILGDLKPAISLEDIQSVSAVRCTFKGFKARFYRNYKTNEYLLTASADSIVIIDEEQDLFA
ncbi:hypothetical protein DS742_11890 [Lacrimispora amygdalina]|uniref:Uncharacterized protein n=1 Tax=Lacrimispora amygdalina TaxID=253257 RepID=A0A3E2NCV6_9FIRM|nr:hypothetical protein [Clostridium indicum]RFZ78803.1 hypothetical protein DS742_11890 [Clostridium indicum]